MPTVTESNSAAVRSVLDAARAEGRTSLTSIEARAICDAYGIPIPGDALATSAQDAAEKAAAIRLPGRPQDRLADILHKTDVGGVIVGLDDAAAVSAAYDTIIASAKQHVPGAKIDGVQVQAARRRAASKSSSAPSRTPASASSWPSVSAASSSKYLRM